MSKQRTPSDPHTRQGDAGGTRKSRVKPLRTGSAPPGVSQAVMLNMPTGRKAEGITALEQYMRANRTNRTGGYTSPTNPRNRRITLNVHRINATLRYPLDEAELTRRLGFYKRADYRACLKAAAEEEMGWE